MKYIDEPGAIRDDIQYGLLYFCKSAYIKAMEKRYKIGDALKYFEEVKNSCPPLDECVLPFFYTDSETPCFLGEFFRNKMVLHTCNFKDFIIRLQHMTKSDLLDYLFTSISEKEKVQIQQKDSALIQRMFKRLKFSSDMKAQAMYLLHHFDYVLGKLIETLLTIHEHNTLLRVKYSSIITQENELIKTKECKILFKKMYSLSDKQYKEQIFSICLLSPYIVIEQTQKERDESVFLLGYRYKEVLEKVVNKENISLETALTVLGDTKCFRIVKMLKKHGSLTQSELQKETHLTRTPIYNGINKLLIERIIVICKREGSKIYYKVNSSYLKLMSKLLSDFADECEEGAEE